MVSIDTVIQLRDVQVAPGVSVQIGGFLAMGDGGGGEFLSVPRLDPTTGDLLHPDHGLLFPTGTADVLLQRQGVPIRTVQMWEIAPHAFPANTTDGQRRTVVTGGASSAPWWGAVEPISWPPPSDPLSGPSTEVGILATTAQLYEAVTGAPPTTNADLFAVYPFLKEGVFLQRNERADWQRFSGAYLPVQCPNNDPGCETSPDRDPAFPECVAGLPPQPSGPFGTGVPPVETIHFHVAALQSAIERALPTSGTGVVQIPAGTYRIDRHLTVRKPTEIRLPREDDFPGGLADFELLRAGYPQGGAFFVIPSWEAFQGSVVFSDELVYGEAIPAARFEDVGRGEVGPVPGDTIRLPIPPPPELVAGRELYLRRGRSDHDSVEPFATGWHTIDDVTGLDLNGDGQDDACDVKFGAPLGEAPLVMQMQIVTAVPENGTYTGDNFEDGVLRVTLAAPTTKALKCDNPDLFSVPRWRTKLVWTNPSNGTTATTRLLHRKERIVGGTRDGDVAASVLYPIGSTVLRLCVDPESKHTPNAGWTAEWNRESWAFLPYTDPRGSRISGVCQAGPVLASGNVAATAQAYTCRDIILNDLRAATPAGLKEGDRIDRALILTSTEGVQVGRAQLVTPEPTSKRLRTWAADLQQSRDTVLLDASVVGSLGGGIQFEEAYDERVGADDSLGSAGPLAVDLSLRDLGADDPLQGTLISTTYTSRNCSVGRVSVRPYVEDPVQPNPDDAFLRVRHGLIGVAGEPSAANPRVELAIRSVDLGADTGLVRPHYVKPFDFGDSGDGSLVYRAGQGNTITWASNVLASRLPFPSNDIPLPEGGTEPFAVVVPGVVRTLDASLQGTGGVLMYHRQGGSVIVSGPVTPEQSADADAAMQVYTGRGWRPYGLLIAVPPAGGWPAFAAVRWSGEHFLANVPEETPDTDSVFGRVEVTLPNIQPGNNNLPFSVTELPAELQTAAFVAGVRLTLLDRKGNVATITGGKATLGVRARYRVDGVRNTGFALQQYVAGPGVEATGTQIAVDLVSAARAVATARGERLYWPRTDRVSGETVSRREWAVTLSTASVERPGQPVEPFSVDSADGPPYQIVAEALVSL